MATATTNKNSSDSAPSGQSKNGKAVKVPAELRRIAVDVEMKESAPGLFEKPVRNDKAEQTGMVFWDFRPDEEGKPHPEGRVRLHDGLGYNDDVFHLNRNPLAATIMRRRNEYLASVEEMCKKAQGTAGGEVEDPVVEEINVPAKKPSEQVNQEAHDKYGKKTAADYAAPSGSTPYQPEPPKTSGLGQGLASDYAARQEQKAAGAQSAKNDAPAGSTVPAVTAPECKPIVNKNSRTAIKVNDIEIPNEYIVLYPRKDKLGKVVDYSPYILGQGLEYLAGKMGLWMDPRSKDPAFPTDQLTPAIQIVPVKLPGQENDWGGKGDVVFKGIVRMKDGQPYEDYGTATSKNLNTKQQKYPIEMAIRRAKNRALRTATHCNICSLEEADLDPKDGTIIDAEFTVVSDFGGGQ